MAGRRLDDPHPVAEPQFLEAATRSSLHCRAAPSAELPSLSPGVSSVGSQKHPLLFRDDDPTGWSTLPLSQVRHRVVRRSLGHSLWQPGGSEERLLKGPSAHFYWRHKYPGPGLGLLPLQLTPSSPGNENTEPGGGKALGQWRCLSKS